MKKQNKQSYEWRMKFLLGMRESLEKQRVWWNKSTFLQTLKKAKKQPKLNH